MSIAKIVQQADMNLFKEIKQEQLSKPITCNFSRAVQKENYELEFYVEFLPQTNGFKTDITSIRHKADYHSIKSDMPKAMFDNMQNIEVESLELGGRLYDRGNMVFDRGHDETMELFHENSLEYLKHFSEIKKKIKIAPPAIFGSMLQLLHNDPKGYFQSRFLDLYLVACNMRARILIPDDIIVNSFVTANDEDIKKDNAELNKRYNQTGHDFCFWLLKKYDARIVPSYFKANITAENGNLKGIFSGTKIGETEFHYTLDYKLRLQSESLTNDILKMSKAVRYFE